MVRALDGWICDLYLRALNGPEALENGRCRDGSSGNTGSNDNRFFDNSNEDIYIYYQTVVFPSTA